MILYWAASTAIPGCMQPAGHGLDTPVRISHQGAHIMRQDGCGPVSHCTSFASSLLLLLLVLSHSLTSVELLFLASL